MKTLTISICALMLAICARGLSPQLTSPRFGDRLTLYRLDKTPSFIDSISMSPDLSRENAVGREEFKVWPPSHSDTVTAFVITRGREIVRLTQVGDSVRQAERLTPGKQRIFETLPFYGYPYNTDKVREIHSVGKTDAIGEFATKGQWSSEIVKGLSAVTFNGDTIVDVECVRTFIEEILVYKDLDTTVYKGNVRNWYAPGYRYPILSNEDGLLFSLSGDTIDCVSEWHAVDLAEMEENIKDDPVNELIRNRDKTPRDNNSSDPGARRSGESSPSKSDKSVIYNADSDQVVITPLFSDNEFLAYILCDLSGRVYDYGELGADSVSISTIGYLPGIYLVHISTKAEPIIYKFIISPR